MILHYFMLVLLAVIWGTSFAAIKIGVETIPPVSLAAARILMAGGGKKGEVRRGGRGFLGDLISGD